MQQRWCDALVDAAPPASLIASSYQLPRSWRASLEWFSNISWLQLKWNALASWDLSQPSVRDANFAGVPRLALASEAGRPVYVSSSAIDAATGSVSATESRRSAQFGRVAVRGSELRGYGGQTTLSIIPDVFRMRNVPLGLFGSLSYTLQSSRRQYLGFDGATAGDPTQTEWSASNSDARHIVVLQGAFTVPRLGTFTLFTRAQSGLPFTPSVQGDINGDGRSGDRAFVPNSSQITDARFAEQLLALQTTGSPTALRCLAVNAGRIAWRNSCRGPWSATMNVQYRLALPKALQRVQANLFFENVLGGVDQLVHGTSALRGWGGAAAPDPVLLVPRGFDAAARAFRYDVNQRFAETRPSRSTLRFPFRVTLDVAVRLTTDYSLQELRRALSPVRVAKVWQPRTVDSLTALYLQRTSNIYSVIVAESDSLFLTPAQIAALQQADAVYSERVRGIYRELGSYLGQFAGARVTKAALDSTNASKKSYWVVFWQQPEIAGALLTPTQRELMPLLRDMLQVTPAQRKTSQYFFGSAVRFAAPNPTKPAAPTTTASPPR